ETPQLISVISWVAFQKRKICERSWRLAGCARAYTTLIARIHASSSPRKMCPTRPPGTSRPDRHSGSGWLESLGKLEYKELLRNQSLPTLAKPETALGKPCLPAQSPKVLKA